MPLLKFAKSSFAAGHVTSRIFGRIDIEQYGAGAATIENFIVLPHGPVVYRPGTTFADFVNAGNMDFVRLFPFVFSNSQASVIEAGPGYMRIFTDHGLVLDSMSAVIVLTTPYSASDLNALKFVQSGDIMTFFHRDHAPRELRRNAANNWTFAALDFLDGPYGPVNTKTTTLNPSALAGTVTITASSTDGINDGQGFLSTDVGRLIRLANPGAKWGWGKITGVTSATQVSLTWRDSPDGAAAATTLWRLGAWSDTEGWPSTGVFHQDRLFTARGQTIFFSETGSSQSHTPSDPKDDAVLADNGSSFRISGGKTDVIQWLSAGRFLEVGTGSAEFTVSGGASGAEVSIQPDNLLVRKANQEIGSFGVSQPVFTRRGTVFLNRTARKLYNSFFSFTDDGQAQDDITLLAEGLTEPGLIDLAYQDEPDQIISAARGDGAIFCVTFNPARSAGVIAAYTHIMGGEFNGGHPIVESVTAIPSPDGTGDELWMSVVRTAPGTATEVRSIEFMAPIFGEEDALEDGIFLDSAVSYDGPPATNFTGADHLNGYAATVLADGMVISGVTVTDGSFSIPAAASKVHIGHGYQGRVVLLPLEVSTPQQPLTAREYRVREVGLLLNRSLGGKVGISGGKMEPIVLRDASNPMTAQIPLFSGLKQVHIEADSELRPSVEIIQDVPLPFMLTGVYSTVEI